MVKPINATDAIRVYVMNAPINQGGYAFKVWMPNGVAIPSVITKNYIGKDEGISIYATDDNFRMFMGAIAKATLEHRLISKK